MLDQDTQDLVRDAARQWVVNEHPVEPDHHTARAGARDRWLAMAELGWAGIAVDEANGGLGLGVSGLAVLAEELGRELVPTPLISSGLLAPQVLASRPELLAQVIAGTAIVALVLDKAPQARNATVAERVDAGWHISGPARFVLDGADADWLIVAAGVPADLFLIPRERCAMVALDTVDGRSMAHATFDVRVAAEALLCPGQGVAERLGDLARIGLAAEMLGAAARGLEIIVDFLKTRRQFGSPIGAFQALQHRAAEMLIALELARASVEQAARGADGGEDIRAAAAQSKYMANRAVHLVGSEIVQMHGGMGMTAEHVAGRYLKWARVSEQLFGNASDLARRYADACRF